MQYLVVYDSATGNLVTGTMAGGYVKPTGTIKYLETDIPEGRYPVRVDVSETPHTVVLSEAPRDLVAEKIAEIENRQGANDSLNLMVLEAMADLYETVLPFLPPM